MSKKLSVEEWMNLVEEEKTSSEEVIRINKIQKDLERERKRTKELSSLLELSSKRENLLLDFQDWENDLEPIIPTQKSSRAEATAIVLASDWHVEEQVDPSTVNGLNAYNLEISEKRARQFFQGILWHVRSHRHGESQEYGYHIENLILWLGGDLISGYIHEELMESNFLSPIEAIRFCTNLICTGLDYLLKEGNFKKITIPCSYGNHGRTSMKRRHSTGAKNSFEWLMYHQIRKIYENEPRVEFAIADGSHLYLDVYDWTFRFHHGDDIRYGGGIGGVTIPLRKAVDAWNIGKHADITVIGHFHQFVDENFAVVNGSLIGYNAFAQSIKARYEPPRQAFFLVDRDRGKKEVSPIYVDEMQRRMPCGRKFPQL